MASRVEPFTYRSVAFDHNSMIDPSMEKFHEDILEEEQTSYFVSNGCVDIRGRIADKRTTGGWKSAPFIIVNEVAERLAFFAVGVSMVTFMFREMHQTIPSAASHVSEWIGAAYILTLLGAFLADSYLGRFRTIIVFSTIYALGMVLLTIQASVDSLRPPPCAASPCNTKATDSQNLFLFTALGLIALGTGGIKPCVSCFGADQFDEADEKEVEKKYSFFNWFFFAINMGALLGLTVCVYIQDRKGSGWGFGVPTAALIISIMIIIAGLPFYRYQKPTGSPFTRFLQVIVVSMRNHLRGIQVESDANLFEVKSMESDILGARKLCHTEQYRFFDKAAVLATEPGSTKNRWRVCTVTQVEEFKSFIRILPVWASTIALSISFTQFSTFFITQATFMDRKLGPDFAIPASTTPIFGALNALILVPIYEKWIVPILRKRTGHPRGISSLQRMGAGLFVSIFALLSAAVIEKKRRNEDYPISVFWLFPQFFLMGTAEVFTYVGQLEFFYDEATDGTRSICSAMFLSEIGIGSFLNTALVNIVTKATGGEEKGWLRNGLNQSKLDYYYWILTAINLGNFFLYLLVASCYKGRQVVVEDVPVVELELEGSRD
ncbi:hypothetical protein ACFE04_028926 [Oxalis oulophora]